MKIFKLGIFLAVAFIVLASFRTASLPPSFGLQPPGQHLADTVKYDARTGLIEDKNLPLVVANCTACHSTKLIQQHRFSREGWTGKIRWMQKNHNLWDLEKAEQGVLDYLEQYYSPKSAANKIKPRRAPLENIKWYKL